MKSVPRISVFGLGYVGCVSAAGFAEGGLEVVGCDVNPVKVDALNAGSAPIREPGLDQLVKDLGGRLRATGDAAEAVRESDISVVCVGTPANPSGGQDMSAVESVSGEIAEALREKEGSHAVVYKSTMLPGSTRLLAEQYFRPLGDGVEVFFLPEFLRQGTALADFREPGLSVVGVPEEGGGTESIAALLRPDTETMILEEAEMLKYACNAFHATKVVFANEIGRIGKQLGVDSGRVMEMLCRDEVLNISKRYLRPGTPFGGSCLPKDVRALCRQAHSLGVDIPLMDSLLESNGRHLESLCSRIEAAGNRSVLLVGLAFKEGTDDLRGSALLELAAALLLKQYSVRIIDPEVAPEALIGANKRFAESKLPGIDTLLAGDLAEAFGDGGSKTIVVSKPCVDAGELAGYLVSGTGHRVIDVNGWPELAALAPACEGFCRGGNSRP